MIRPLTCLCMLLAGGSGLYLYQTKHRAQLLDREITRVVQSADAARARTKMLRAEWAWLNEPERLQDLSERFLQLKPMAPSQFVPMTELAQRLPAPAVFGAAPSSAPELAPEDAEETPIAHIAPAARPGAAARGGPVQVASITPPRPARPTARPIPATPPVVAEPRPSRPVPTPTETVRREPATQSALAYAPRPVPLAAPRPVHASVVEAMAMPMPAQARPSVRAIEAYAPAPAIGSALGMAHVGLAPPVPVPVGLR